MLIQQQNGQYVVQLGIMGEEAMPHLVYKPNWFYAHLIKVKMRLAQNHVVSELFPTHQGRNEKSLRTINGLNAFAMFTDIFTQKDLDTGDTQILGKLQLAGNNAQLAQSIFQNDPEGWTWEFRVRALIDRETYVQREGQIVVDANGNPLKRRTLIPKVEKVITWDLHPKYN